MIIDKLSYFPDFLGYLIIFFALMTESLPLIGLIIPGMTIVFLAGFAAHLGYLDLSLLIIICSLAAISGDVISYILGRKYGISFIKRYGKYLLIKEEYIAKTEIFMKAHLNKSVILGRFNPITRVFVPFLFGVHKSSFSKFIIADITGGVIWASSLILVGFLAGQSYKIAEKYIGGFFYIALIIGILIYLLYYYVAIKKKYLTHKDITLVLGVIFSILIFVSILDDVHDNGFWDILDIAINSFITSIQNNSLIAFSKILNFLFDTPMMGIFTILISILLYFRDKRNAVFFASVMILDAILIYIFKLLIHRERPLDSLLVESTYSFPSGHSATAIVFFGLIIYLFWKTDYKEYVKNIAYIISGVMIITIALSRVYLNVHWMSDVLGGLVLGVFVLSSCLLLRRLWERKLYINQIK